MTRKGQVTIPKRVRDELGLRPGARVRIESDGAGGARLTAAQEAPSRFAKFRGIAKNRGGLTTDDIMLLMRGEPDW